MPGHLKFEFYAGSVAASRIFDVRTFSPIIFPV